MLSEGGGGVQPESQHVLEPQQAPDPPKPSEPSGVGPGRMQFKREQGLSVARGRVTTVAQLGAQLPAKADGWGSGRASGEPLSFGDAAGAQLNGYLARPSFSAASGSGRNGVVLSHGFPEAGTKAGSPSYGYPQLAVRLAAETGATVLTFDFRTTGGSQGEPSLDGWRTDLAAGVTALRAVDGIEKIWLVGFAVGGTLSICAAGEDPSIAGVAAFGPPAELIQRGDPRRSLAASRSSGIARKRGYAPGPGTPSRDLRAVNPSALVAKIPPRPLLIVYGAADDVVPMTDVRGLADAADESAELRILAGAGHILIHDPRAIALLLGWFDRHLGAGA